MIVNRRYPGTTPFEKEQKDVFFGREIDIENLQERIKFEPLLLLYSKSGLGKSSLLNAGLQPRLELKKNTRAINIRFTRYAKGGVSPVENIVSKINLGTEKRSLIDRIIKNENSLWYYFKKIELESNEKQQYILIFDQFEELFSYPEEDIKQFKKQLADLLYVQMPQHFRDELNEMMDLDPEFIGHKELEKLYQPIDIKVITAIRSDKMSQMNALTDYLPNLLKNYYQLEAMDRERAKDAIVNPAIANGEFLSDKFSYDPILLEKILDYLTEDNTKPIETFQLQIICARAEIISMRKKREKNKPANSIVSDEDLKDLKNIFADHYSETIGLIKDKEQQIFARKLLEDKLIVDGNRISLPDVLVLKEEGMTNDLINHLVNSRILRAEPNTVGGLSYELSHDTLVAPILAARKIRVDKEEETKAEYERKEELRKALEKAEKERIEREKKQKQQRKIIYIVSAAALISVTFGIFGFINMKKSKSRLEELIVKDAQSYFDDEKFLKAKSKFEELLNYTGTKQAIEDSIKDCTRLNSLKIIFDSKLDQVNNLIKVSEIEDLKTAQELLREIEKLDYRKGKEKLETAQKMYALQVGIKIKENERIAKMQSNSGLYDDARNTLKQIESLKSK